MITRKEYMNRDCIRNGRYDGWLGHVRHREYYGQFITPGLIKTVRQYIGDDVLRESRDSHFNDIALQKWDGIPLYPATVSALREAGDNAALSQHACIYKEAARQWLQSEGWQEWPVSFRYNDGESLMGLARGRNRDEAIENAKATRPHCLILQLFEPDEIQPDSRA